jgi:hypothetical protein
MAKLAILISMTLSFSAVFSAPAWSQESLQDILDAVNPENKLFKNPDFPMSQKDVSNLFVDIRNKVTDLEPAPGLTVEFISGRVALDATTFVPLENRILFNRRLVPGDVSLSKIAKSKVELGRYQAHYRTFLTHEYAHALLNPIFMARAEISAYFAKFQGLVKSGASIAGIEDILIQTAVLYSFYELFADLLASVYRDDPRTMATANKYIFEHRISDITTNVNYRSFDKSDFLKSGKVFIQKYSSDVPNMKGDKASVIFYEIYFPNRHIIWSLLSQSPDRRAAISKFATLLADLAVKSLKRPVEQLTVSELNKNLEESLLGHDRH